jgi:hypothetical protein
MAEVGATKHDACGTKPPNRLWPCNTPLGEVATDVYREPVPADTIERPLPRTSVLVRRQDESRFLDEVERLRARWPASMYRLLLTGPCPPYRLGGIDPSRTDDA